MTSILYIVLPLAGIIVGWLIRLIYGQFQLSIAEQRAQRLKKDAVKDAEAYKKDLLLASREEIEKNRHVLEQDLRERQNTIRRVEQRLEQQGNELEKKAQLTERQQQSLENRERRVIGREKRLENDAEKLQNELAKIARLSREEARVQLMASLEETAKRDAQVIISKIEDAAVQESEEKGRQILLGVMQRLASEVSSEATVSTVYLPNEQMKGRVIGREGRNIKALETLTGVDFIIDEGSEGVILSCFDPVRRAIAREALEYLVSDGRIHPTKIEEVVERITTKINKQMYESGERTIFDLGISDMHPDIIRVLGALLYRSSYGQNLLAHSKEVAVFGAMIAAELNADRELAKRACLLHDIGKGIVTQKEAGHVELGVELAQRCGESPEVVNAIAAHHGDVPSTTIEAIIVQIADSLSAARPGARNETLENYFKRLKNLEDIANEFDGIEKAFAIQAGRELRIIVNNEQVTDEESREVARSIAQAIEKRVRYPGRIRITIIRETRIIEYAR